VIAGPETRDEVLLDRAERPTADELDLHRALAYDRADREAMAHRDHPAGDHVAPVLHHDLAVLGVRAQRVAAVGDEVEHPGPLGPGEVAIGVGRANFVEQLAVRNPAERDRDGVLRERSRLPDRSAP
jgi:hypothetical protein